MYADACLAVREVDLVRGACGAEHGCFADGPGFQHAVVALWVASARDRDSRLAGGQSGGVRWWWRREFGDGYGRGDGGSDCDDLRDLEDRAVESVVRRVHVEV